MTARPPSSTLFPYTPLFRSRRPAVGARPRRIPRSPTRAESRADAARGRARPRRERQPRLVAGGVPRARQHPTDRRRRVRRREHLLRIAMKFGLFYEHQLPRPWDEDSEYTLLQNALEQCELADKLGIQHCWEVEHHFLEEYSHSSAPEVFLAAVSQRTKEMRLGHGIVQTPPAFNHPARVAERISTLDLISAGRVDFGTGAPSSEPELGGFPIDPIGKRRMWEEGLPAPCPGLP